MYNSIGITTNNIRNVVNNIDLYSGSCSNASSTKRNIIIEKVTPATFIVSVFTETNSW